MEQNIKAVFTDVDGTLLNSVHRVTPGTRDWIHRILQRGIHFVIVSARSPSGIYPIMRRNDLHCALISYSGAMIMDEDRNILYSRQIDRQTALRIEEFIREKGYDLSLCIYSGDDWLAPDKTDPRVINEERIVEAQSREGTVADLAPGEGVNKFLCICAPGTILEVEREMKEAFPDVAVVKSSDIAFGDNYNDVEMLQTAGRGYVMGNAPEEIQQMFAFTTADNDHDGIAEVLEQLFAGDM